MAAAAQVTSSPPSTPPRGHRRPAAEPLSYPSPPSKLARSLLASPGGGSGYPLPISPERKGPRVYSALTNTRPEDAAGAAVAASPPTRRKLTLSSPEAADAAEMSKLEAQATQRPSAEKVCTDLLRKWLLEDTPDATCLACLGIPSDDPLAARFSALYRECKQARDAKILTAFSLIAHAIRERYGEVILTALSPFELIQAFRTQTLKKRVFKRLKDNPKWLLNVESKKIPPLFLPTFPKLQKKLAGTSEELSFFLLNESGEDLQTSPLIARLNDAFETIDISPFAQLLAEQIDPKDHTDLLDQQQAHSAARSRNLPKLYVSFANHVRLLKGYVPERLHPRLSALFVELANMGSRPECIAELYRSTQAHANVSVDVKRNLSVAARQIYLASGRQPPPAQEQAVEGAHALPHPGAFSIKQAAVETAFASSPFDPGPVLKPNLTLLKESMNRFTKGIIDEEELTGVLKEEFDRLYPRDPDHFVWNAYWTLANLYLHAFSESDFFPAYVNHEIDPIHFENKALLAQALATLVTQALASDTPLTLEQGHIALSTLYRWTLQKCGAMTVKQRALFTQTHNLQHSTLFWMTINILLTLPPPRTAAGPA